MSGLTNLRLDPTAGRQNSGLFTEANGIMLNKICISTESVPDREGNIHHWLSFKFPLHSGEVFLGGVALLK